MGKGSVKKLYYSIGEVSSITDLEPHVLRYWESAFSKLRPQKNKAGNRTYRIRDIQLIFQIKKLLYEDKFTIEGAKKRLSSGVEGEPNQLRLTFAGDQPKILVQKVKKELQDILKLLDS